MKALAYAVLGLSALATAVFVRLLQPASLEAGLAIGAWLLLPHALLTLVYQMAGAGCLLPIALWLARRDA